MSSGTSAGSSGLDTVESIVIDGANAVTREPREHFRHAALSLSVSVVAIVLMVGVRRWRPLLAPWVLIAAAAPGLITVAMLRGDAPLQRPALAAKVRGTLEAMQQAAPWPKTVAVTHESDDVLFPLGRYAVPARRDDGELTLELYGASAEATCVATSQRAAVCGQATP